MTIPISMSISISVYIGTYIYIRICICICSSIRSCLSSYPASNYLCVGVAVVVGLGVAHYWCSRAVNLSPILLNRQREPGMDTTETSKSSSSTDANVNKAHHLLFLFSFSFSFLSFSFSFSLLSSLSFSLSLSLCLSYPCLYTPSPLSLAVAGHLMGLPCNMTPHSE